MTKGENKTKAIALRQKGKSYGEILAEVKVAKSTLSLWLRDVGLSHAQKQNISAKRQAAQKRGAAKRLAIRLEKERTIKNEARATLGKIDRRSALLAGAMLYWAEGNKQKEHAVSVGVKFSNSDPAMIKFVDRWLKEFCGVKLEDVHYELYVHDNGNANEIKDFWVKYLNLSPNQVLKTRIKKGSLSGYRKNKGDKYVGLIRINVRRSTNLNRRIMGWVEALCNQYT